MTGGGVGGIAADQRYVIVGSRDPADQQDLFECYDAATGQLVWGAFTAAPGQLDYGNSPRATPLLAEGFVYTLGAFGDLSALDLETGALLWTKNLVRDLGGTMPEWGYAASPLLIGETLIVQPGGPETSLVGLDCYSGDLLWQAAGKEAAYASLIPNSLTNPAFIAGLDVEGVCGWDLKGKLLWKLKPDVDGDFGVPSPVLTKQGLVASSENNGTRLYPWEAKQQHPTETAIAHQPKANPNSHTPIVVGDHLIVAGRRLECYDLENDLQLLWSVFDRDLKGYVSLLATEQRILACTQNGTLLLLSPQSGEILGRLSLTDRPVRLLAHPAIVGNQLYVRVHDRLMRIDL